MFGAALLTRDLTRTGSITNGVENIEIYGKKSLPLILALSSPGLPEIIIFGHVGAILRRPTMFRMHILNQQVDERYHQRDGGSTTVYTAYTVNFVYTVHTVYTVDTIQTAFTRTA